MPDNLSLLANTFASPIDTYGTLLAPAEFPGTALVYRGPNLRSFLAGAGIDPERWREILRYNQIGSAFDLQEGISSLYIPDRTVSKILATHPDA